VVDTRVELGRARLDHCLGALPARERLVVALTFVADFDGEDIARELATTIGNVRVVRHRALRQLHECMTRGAA
jgi:RNA polymerase sigma-70 factor (ECF subfamily)